MKAHILAGILDFVAAQQDAVFGKAHVVSNDS
jgi:hypothetical protein